MDDPAAIAELALELGEDRGRQLLLSVNAFAAYRLLNRMCAIRFSIHLLRNREPRPAIVERLVQLYKFSERTAYRVLDEAATQFCQIERGIGKKSEQDHDSDTEV